MNTSSIWTIPFLHIICSAEAFLPRSTILKLVQRSFDGSRIRHFPSLGLRFLAYDPEDSGCAEKVGSESLKVDGTFLRVCLAH